MNEIELNKLVAMLRRAADRLEKALAGHPDPDRLLVAAERACRRAEARIERLRRELEAEP